MDQTAVGVQRRLLHHRRTGAARLFAGEHPGHDGTGTFTVHLDADLQEAFPLAPVKSQHPVARDFGDGLRVIIILGVDAVLLLGLGAGDPAESPVIPAQFGAAGRIVGDFLCDDIPGTGQGRLSVGDFLVEIVCGDCLGVQGGILFQDGVGQRLQSPGLGNAGPGLALGFIGTVEVLHLGQRFGLGQRRRQFRRHGPLLGDGGGDLLLALVQPPQVLQAVAQIAQHLVVHRAGGLLAVAGNEGNRVALVDQVDGPLHVLDAQVQFCGQLFSMIRHSVSSFFFDTKPPDTLRRPPARPG